MSILIPYNQLSEEQKGVIRRISRESGNLFVEGPPGSGKTLISLYTLRDIVKDETVKPLLMMYNHSLYGFLSSALSSLGISDNITIVTKDKFFWDLARGYGIQPPDYNEKYNFKYDYIINGLLSQTLEKTHGITIVDEVQDLSKEEWDVITKISKRVLTLGDFEQSVYKSSLQRDDVKNFGIFESLSVIFRFHKNIAKLAKIFSRKKDNLEDKVKDDSQVQPQIFDISRNEENSKIVEILNQIKSYKQRIAIISIESKRLIELSNYLTNNKISHKYYADNKDLGTHDFTSVEPLLLTAQSSKGLEFEHVILFGFDNANYSISKLRSEGVLNSVLYVSITRTNAHLYIIRSADTIQEVKNLKVDIEEVREELGIDDLF